MTVPRLAALAMAALGVAASAIPTAGGARNDRAAVRRVRPAATAPSHAVQGALASLATLPLRFEPNVGQVDPQVRFSARGGAYSLFLTDGEAVFAPAAPPPGDGPALPAPAPVRMRLVGANPAAPVEGVEAQPGVTNYLHGADPGAWHTGVAGYAQAAYRGAWPGVDVVFHQGGGTGLEYDFVVAPGADPASVTVAFDGGSPPHLEPGGDLVVKTGAGELRHHAPVLYQEIDGKRRPVSGRFVAKGGDQVGFTVGRYDHSRPLVIDPTLAYSTFLADYENVGAGIAVDSSGAVYVTGQTSTTDFPTRGPLQATYGGMGDAWVAKLNPAASGSASLVYATYLGGSGVERAAGIAVDATGAAYVGGRTSSADFPVRNGYRMTYLNEVGHDDGFLAKLAPDGASLAYATYMSGGILKAVAVDGSANVYVAGGSGSANFTTTPGALKPTCTGCPTNNRAVVARLNTAASGAASLVYATYLGGSTDTSVSGDNAQGIAVDGSGRAYVVGSTTSSDFPTTAGAYDRTCGTDGNCDQSTPCSTCQPVYYADAFLSVLSPTGGGLAYSTYFGGSSRDVGVGVAVDGSGNAYVVGNTTSGDLPTRNAYQAALVDSDGGFVAKFNPGAAGDASLAYSTFLSGTAADTLRGIAVDGSGNAYVAGDTFSGDFPAVHAMQAVDPRGDAVVAKLNPAASGSASLVYSTPLGGTRNDIADAVAVDGSGNAYIIGGTGSDDFPMTAGAFRATRPQYTSTYNAFYMAKLGPGDTPLVRTVAPRSGPNTGGTPVVVTGEHLSGVTTVDFGGVVVACPSSVCAIDSDTQLSVVSPPHPGSTVAELLVQVRVSNAQTTSFANPAGRFAYGEGVFTPGAAVCPSPAIAANCVLQGGVVLQSGKVLFWGRGGDGVVVGTLYDPATGAWAATGACGSCDLGVPTVLANGKVLVAGGTLPGGLAFGASNAANLYDPATGTWSATGSMTLGRLRHTATLLADGRVLVAGGCTLRCSHAGNDDPSATAEVYDPAAGTWALTGSMATARYDFTATRLDPAVGSCGPYCGQVVALGGGDSRNFPIGSIERYDPNAVDATTGIRGVWSGAGSLVVPRWGHGIALLRTGKVLVQGGYNSRPPFISNTTQNELYDPVAATSAATSPTASLHYSAYGALGRLANGKALAAAGGNSPDSDVAELYDPSTGTWMSAGISGAAGGTTSVLPPGPLSACGTNCGKVLQMNGTVPLIYTPRPAITSLAPLSGLAAGGTTVTVTGTGLASVSSVKFGAVAGTNLVHDPTSPDTKLTVRSPAGTTGTSVDVTVSSAGGISAVVPADRFAFGLLRQIVANFDGDTKTDVSVFRPADAVWFIHNSAGGDPFVAYGATGDIPVPGDYDGDGKTDIAVWRPTTGVWYIRKSSGGDIFSSYGANGYIPVPGDYDGDGKTDLAVFRPSDATWFIHYSGGGDPFIGYGTSGDVPVPGDYDGDGKTDIAVWRPATGVWYIRKSSGGDTFTSYGANGYIPLPLAPAIRLLFFGP